MKKKVTKKNTALLASRLATVIGKCKRAYTYLTSGVWSDTRRNWMVDTVKTLNLSVRSFLNGDLQVRAAALTYQTLLAIVPALALVFAICRGFGFQNLVQSQIFSAFPAQEQAISTAMSFVDSYLSQSSEGIFVGVGILFLLWTLISLISSVEYSFNKIWNIQQGRTIWRKVTDYTAIVLILPILIICASGITVFMSSALQGALNLPIISPLLSGILDCSSVVLVWLFFAGTYLLVPNTKVKFKNAFFAGVLAGTAFLILQWLFVSGQVYVTRYNAIYGSFAFLPLLLIWLQLVWLITLSGAVYCYSSQNIFEFSFSDKITDIAEECRWRILLAVMTIAIRRFVEEKKPLTDLQISLRYNLPISLVTLSANRLINEGLMMRVVQSPGSDEYALSPAVDPSTFSLGEFLRRMMKHGTSQFIPGFARRFVKTNEALDSVINPSFAQADKILISSLTINDIKNETTDRH